LSGFETPILRTTRLTLRAPAMEDFPAYFELMASSRARYMGGPFDVKGAWGYFCHDVAGWALFGHGALMIELKATGEVIGQVGINHGPLFPEKELGWLLYDGYEGHGYATEAAAALRDWAKNVRGIGNLVSYIDADNAVSEHVAVRLGAVRDDHVPRQDPLDLVYRHPV
jgi:RimJ/RimL family protein N-acetyltransferase